MNYYYYQNVTLPKVIAKSFSIDSDSITFDLKSVYPVPSLLTFIRSNIFSRYPGYETVVIQDSVKFSSPTSYEFGIPSRDGKWTETSVTSNSLSGTFTVSSTTVNVSIRSSNPFKHTVVTKTANGVTYTRLSIAMINPILEDNITVAYF